MFLFQKFKYNTAIIDTEEKLSEVLDKAKQDAPSFVCFDTETTGLNFMKDTPFLMTFGWGKDVYGVDLIKHPDYLDTCYEVFAVAKYAFAHNAVYDYHMLTNFGKPISDNVRVADSSTIARLTNYADLDFNKDLAYLGSQYVDESAKFASKIIKEHLQRINKVRKNLVKSIMKAEYPQLNFNDVWEAYNKQRVKYISHPYDDYFRRIDEIYQPANYMDVYMEKPNLMWSYAFDDIVIMLEWLNKAIPVLKTVDIGLRVFQRECALIRPTARQERIGFKLDVNYLVGTLEVMTNYQNDLYTQLRALTGIPTLAIGQHAVLRRLFARKYNMILDSVDKKNLSRVNASGELKRIIHLIQELRTVDKWISTYIKGMLNRSVDGRIYTSIDLAGTVSGRVSSNMQQMPKEAFTTEDGTELIHPRKAIITDENYKLWMFDYSQQELRVQAYYTLLTASGDIKLLRAYMPFQCTSILTDEEFDYKNPDVLKRWNSGEWLDENGDIWEPTDVHAETTFKAFPFLENNKEHPEFKHYRKMGKVCNFLKNYQGGKNAIIDQLNVSEDIASALDSAYYKAFPIIRDFQRWVTTQMHKIGYVENLYGRRYYMQSPSNFYRAGNYLVQGSSADMIKTVELKVDKLLLGTRSSFVMPVHDEIIVRIHDDEEYLVPLIKEIMDDVPQVPWVPLLCEVEWTDTNWADKHKWKE